MAADPASFIPEHLRELLAPTPSAMAKLLALWDGLSLETRLALMTEKRRSPEPAYLYEELLARAAASRNPYERYLANKELRVGHLDDDPEPLVRYARLEDADADLAFYAEDPERFFALPHGARLALLRNRSGDHEAVARLIRHALVASLPKREVSELELFELLSDYLNGPGFAAGNSVRDAAGLHELWHLVTALPESLSFALLEALPEPADQTGIPDAVLAALSDAQKTALLARPDIRLSSLRRQVLAGEPPADGEMALEHDILRSAAVRHNLELDDTAFGQLLRQPEPKRSADLRLLAENARDLEACFYAAIGDALAALEQDAAAARQACEAALRPLPPVERTLATRRLRLYRLAAAAEPWAKDSAPTPLPASLAFLASSLVAGEPWATFMLFAKAWERQGSLAAERHLPPALGDQPAVEVVEWRNLPEAIAGRLAEAIEAASGRADRDLGALKTAVLELSQQVALLGGKLDTLSRTPPAPPAAARPAEVASREVLPRRPVVAAPPRRRLRLGVVGLFLLLVGSAAMLVNKAKALELLRTVF
jgi:hypothetical protein